MRYCTRCVLPDTRPEIAIGADGICSACATHERGGTEVDWDARRSAFQQLVTETKALGCLYDCVVPVSGGKDSHWQVLTCLEHGLHVLAVTWRPPGRTQLGQRNVDNLVELGVDHIDFSVNPRVERTFMLRSLERYGTTAIPMHLGIFNIPLAVAARFGIPLVVYGENSAIEYAGSNEEVDPSRLDSAWVRRYGATKGTTAEDWIGPDLTREDLAPYLGPSDAELDAKGTRAIFLFHYFRWDPEVAFEVARSHGFEAAAAPRTGSYDYADVDDDFISVHHHLKWLKFGFTRTYDNLSLEIRNGRLTREQAIELIRQRGDETPYDDIGSFCDYVGIDPMRFENVAESFRNQDVWQLRDGVWQINDFLIPDWDWRAGKAAKDRSCAGSPAT